MEQDLLYSGLMLTAAVLSVWTGLLLTAACVFFASAVRRPGSASSASRPAKSAFDRSRRPGLMAHSSKL
jgi:hypothetical protein